MNVFIKQYEHFSFSKRSKVSGMDIKKLEVLLKVIETKSLTAAGNQLGFTQSGVSHLIRTIEDEFGFPVLIRGKGGVRLTENGQVLLPAIREILNANDHMDQIVANIRGMNFGKLRIGTFASASVLWLPKIIEEFSHDYPGIQIEIIVGGNDSLISQLDESCIDFAIMSNPPKGYEWIHLASDRMLVLLPPGHRLVEKSSVTLDEIADDPFILSNEGFDYDVSQIIKGSGITPRLSFSTMENRGIIAMIQHGLGVTVMPEMVLDSLESNVITKELSPCEYRHMGIIVKSVQTASLAAKTFISYAKRIIGELGTYPPMEKELNA